MREPHPTRAIRHLNALQVKAKGARKMTYPEFINALDHVAAKKRTTADAVAAAICGAAARINATQADFVKFHVSADP